MRCPTCPPPPRPGSRSWSSVCGTGSTSRPTPPTRSSRSSPTPCRSRWPTKGVIDQMAKLGTTPVPETEATPGGAHRQARGADRPVDADHRGSRGHRRMSSDLRRPATPPGASAEAASGRSLPDLLAGGTFVVLGLAFAIARLAVRRRYGAADGLRLRPDRARRPPGRARPGHRGRVVPRGRPDGGQRRPRAGPLAADGPAPRRGRCSSASPWAVSGSPRACSSRPSSRRWPVTSTGRVEAAVIAVGLTALCLLVFVALLQLRLPLLGDWFGG